ncbi:MAG: aminotransferase class I/II-fold pyridoxal phosphate-dependent enzyme [Desulfovibrionaceae bacterium]|nr:aminotransferase class I/II-fold pyridoxal phosphate-dependent enzyme [Desulfovibrionaceae bacterium]
MLTFTKDFTLQEPIPDEGIELALGVLKTGRLHRYNTMKGERGYAADLEEAFAEYMGSKYCLACASCGSALYIALKSLGVKAGDTVLCNAYTLAPVPGAIDNAGANIELVEITDDYTIDLDDLDAKATRTGARFFLLSHMRGHMANMDRVMEIVRKHNLILLEDCAHTMGGNWNGKKSGSFGHAACFSTQTYKHMNSGEGGLLITNDPEVMARAIIYSGSYMLYGAHGARPDLDVFEHVKKITPNFSSRMDNLRAALLLPQLKNLDNQCRRWNDLYHHMQDRLVKIPGVTCPPRDPREYYVGSSIQWNLPKAGYAQIETFIDKCGERGVQVKWFGNREPAGFTSAYDSWQYFPGLAALDLPKTREVLATMCDMRLPLTFCKEDCDIIADIIEDVVRELNLN